MHTDIIGRREALLIFGINQRRLMQAVNRFSLDCTLPNFGSVFIAHSCLPRRRRVLRGINISEIQLISGCLSPARCRPPPSRLISTRSLKRIVEGGTIMLNQFPQALSHLAGDFPLFFFRYSYSSGYLMGWYFWRCHWKNYWNFYIVSRLCVVYFDVWPGIKCD